MRRHENNAIDVEISLQSKRSGLCLCRTVKSRREEWGLLRTAGLLCRDLSCWGSGIWTLKEGKLGAPKTKSADFWGLMVNRSRLHVTERVEDIGSHREGDRTAE